MIATGEVKRAYAKIGRPLCVGDGTTAEYNPVFLNNHKISQHAYPGALWVRSYKGFRPYILKAELERLVYNPDYRAEPGEIFLTDKEREPYKGYSDFILIEPQCKKLPLSKNKDWGIARWQQVVDQLPQFNFIQLRTGKHKLAGPNVRVVDSPGIRDGFAMLERCSLFVGTDGALHHAAAAFEKPAVVVWGGLTSPRNLGYDSHTNLWAGSKPCGSKTPCLHCTFELDKITVSMVVDAIKKRTADTGAGVSGMGSPATEAA